MSFTPGISLNSFFSFAVSFDSAIFNKTVNFFLLKRQLISVILLILNSTCEKLTILNKINGKSSILIMLQLPEASKATSTWRPRLHGL